MRVVIVGAGLIGRKRADALESDDDLLAVLDPDLGRASQLCEQYGGRCARSFSEIEDLDLDGALAVIATSHDQLSLMGGIAAEAGCHLLLEKPGARTSEELDQVESRLAPERIVAVGFNHRFHPAILRLADATRQGHLGQLRLIRGRYGHGGRPGYEKEWRANRELSGGGELLDQGSHLLDLTRFLAGGFDLTHGEIATLYWEMPVEDNAWLMGVLPNGGRASLHASWTEWKNLFSLEVFFTKGKIEVRGLGGSYGPETYIESVMESGFGPPKTTSIEFPPGDTSWLAEWRDIKSRVRKATDAQGATAEDAREVLKVIEEVYLDADF